MKFIYSVEVVEEKATCKGCLLRTLGILCEILVSAGMKDTSG